MKNFDAGSAWSAAEASEFDHHLQQDLGLPGEILMENAGAALARWALQLALAQALERIVLFAGPGHNGGDALVAARQLAGAGPAVELRFPIPPTPPRAAALARRLDALPALTSAPPGGPLDPRRDLIVDGIFGLGLARDLTGEPLAAVDRINASGATVLAVDLPSGLHADRGEALGAVVRATHTLTFVAPKVGMTRARGPEACGDVRVAEIGVSSAYAAAWRRRRAARPTGGS